MEQSVQSPNGNEWSKDDQRKKSKDTSSAHSAKQSKNNVLHVMPPQSYHIGGILCHHSSNNATCHPEKDKCNPVKDVYKTFKEINQLDLVRQAGIRQQYIDQAQSLNLFFRPDVHIKYLHAIHFMAWKKGLKTLYYCRSEKIGKADKVAKKVERKVIEEINMTQIAQGNDCIACEG